MISPARTARRRRGFTLVELLTVIAIIALLAGLLFPVFATARANARKSQCQTQIHNIIQALQMYKDDWRVYPDALYGASFAGGPVELRLGVTDYVKDTNTFTCPDHPHQFKGDQTLVQPINPMTGATPTDRYGRQMAFPRLDSYDMGYRPNKPTGSPELHYNLKWTGAAYGGLSDDKRQLYYRNPPDSTVVTWCLNHSNMDDSGNPKDGGLAVVGFLSGRVQNLPAEKMATWPASCTGASGGALPAGCPWQITPKP